MNIYVAAAAAALTANGGTDGYVTVADNTGFYPGASCWLWSSTQGGTECIITDLSGTTKIGLRPKIVTANGSATYTKGSWAAYVTVDTASVQMPAQIAPAQVQMTKYPSV